MRDKIQYGLTTEIHLPKRNYKKAYNILMEYWEFIPENEKTKVDKRLKGCNL